MSERNNNMLLKSQLESTVKENFELESRVSGMVELNKENSVMKKPIGINALLDEACMFPNSTNATLATKLFQNFHAQLTIEIEVKFIGASPSPFNSRVEIALKLKGIKYEFIREDLSNKSDLLLQSNPVHKRIPVLVHGGKPISESMIILEYIDETWPEINPLRPNDPYERSVARFWTKFVEEKSLCMWLLFGGKGQEKAKEDCHNMLKTLEEQSNIGDNAFFGGDNIGLTDIAFGVLAYWLEIIEDIAKLKIFDAETFPRLHSWKCKFLEVPVIKESLPNRDELTVFLEGRKDWIIAKAESLQVSARS